MSANRVYLLELFDCYKEIFTDNERDTFSNYYEEDLSLSEIAENKNISRSAVQKTIKLVEGKLKEYESKLKLNEIKKELIKLQNR